MKIELKPQFEKLVQEMVNAGLYSAPEEAVEDALLLMETREAKLDRLRTALARSRRDIEEGRFTIVETAEQLDALFEA